MAKTKTFNGKTYRNSNASKGTKAEAKKYAAKAKEKGYNSRIVEVAGSGMMPKHYQIYIRKA